mmetsp:Transcript_38007/g.52764  ORF Transcript_38007/g.52764 Transcript_38007/m.52764 type:complete len:259 (+) Transcript_38007:1-777(+)
MSVEASLPSKRSSADSTSSTQRLPGLKMFEKEASMDAWKDQTSQENLVSNESGSTAMQSTNNFSAEIEKEDPLLTIDCSAEYAGRLQEKSSIKSTPTLEHFWKQSNSSLPASNALTSPTKDKDNAEVSTNIHSKTNWDAESDAPQPLRKDEQVFESWVTGMPPSVFMSNSQNESNVMGDQTDANQDEYKYKEKGINSKAEVQLDSESEANIVSDSDFDADSESDADTGSNTASSEKDNARVVASTIQNSIQQVQSSSE